jgi:hypothetical protein
VRVRDPSVPKLTTLIDALKVFEEMLQRRPLPSIKCFTQILGQLVNLKHYSQVISLHQQMGLLGIAPDVWTLNLTINCHCHLNQMGFSLSVLGRFFKFGFEPDVRTLQHSN